MPTDYEIAVAKAREEISLLTQTTQKELIKFYDNSFYSVFMKVQKTHNPSLVNLQNEIADRKQELQEELKNKITDATKKAAAIGVEPDQALMKSMFIKAGIDERKNITHALGMVQENVVKDILKGKLYLDGKTLDDRIWYVTNGMGKDIQYIISNGLIQQKSAIELAKSLQVYVKPAAERPTTWGKSYPKLKNKAVDYNAMRLARTSITHAYQTATIQAAQTNPFCEYIEWRSSMAHSRTCELCQSRHGVLFPKDQVPLDHPNGLCTMLPVVKDPEEAGKELREWLDGEPNPKLDDWYQEHGWQYGGVTAAKVTPISKNN